MVSVFSEGKALGKGRKPEAGNRKLPPLSPCAPGEPGILFSPVGLYLRGGRVSGAARGKWGASQAPPANAPYSKGNLVALRPRSSEMDRAKDS